MANGSRKVAVIGPLATPPESKAMPVNTLGTKKLSIIAVRYPGIRNTMMLIQLNMRSMAIPSDMPTPIEREYSMAFVDMVPDEISST